MLKRIILIVGFITFVTQTNATHINGADLHYIYQGNNTYEFVLTFYENASLIPFPSSYSLDVTGVGVNTTIQLTLDTNYTLYGCVANTNVWVHKGTAGLTIPSTGLKVIWQQICCRPPAIANLASPGSQSLSVEVELFPVPGGLNSSSSPRYFDAVIEAYTGITNVLNTGVFDPNPQDSVYVELANVKEYGVPLVYSPGFSPSQPFGTAVPTSIDHHTGILTVSGINNMGSYSVGIKASSYRDGQLSGSSTRDLLIQVSNLQDSIPSLSITNLVTTGKATVSGNSMYVDMQPLDTLGFTLNGTVNGPYTLMLDGQGRLLSSTAGTSGSCVSANCATFSAPNGFTGLASVSGNFSYVPDTSIFLPNNSRFNSTINLTVTKSNSCGGVTVVPFTIYISIKKPESIWSVAAVTGCSGDSVQVTIHGDGSNLMWSPQIGVSDPTSSSPYLSATTPTTYTVTNLNDSVSITIDYVLDSLMKPSLVDNSTWAYLPNLADYDLAVWYYNGVALTAGVDSFAMPFPGHYYAFVKSGACTRFSDTIIKVNKNQVPAFDPSKNTTVNSDGNAMLTFELQGSANKLTSLTLVAPDDNVFKTTQLPTISILDNNQFILTKGAANRVSTGFYQLNGFSITLTPNTPYHIEVLMAEGQMVFNKPSSFPFIEANGAIKITDASYFDNNTLINNAFPNFIFGLSSGIGEEEFEAKTELFVYPNPAQGVLRFRTVAQTLFTLMDATGKTVLVEQVDENSEISITNLPRGLYMFQLKTATTTKNGKIILQ